MPGVSQTAGPKQHRSSLQSLILIKFLDKIYHLLSWIWGSVIVGGLLVGIIINYFTIPNYDAAGDLRSWRIVEWLTSNIFTGAGVIAGLSLLTGVSWFAHHSELTHPTSSSVPAPTQPPRKVPAPPVDFIGHQTDLKALSVWLQHGESVAVTGMGGIGKSTLATAGIRIIASKRGMYPGGIATIDCKAFSGISGVAAIYNRVLAEWKINVPDDLREQLGWKGTEEDDVELLSHVLKSWRQPFSRTPASPILVFLDNVRDDLPLGELLDTLATINITVLLTTRKLPASARLHIITVHELDLPDALNLFVARYTAQNKVWNSARDEKPVSLAIERLLGRLPLAIELAAAWAARTPAGTAILAQELEKQGPLKMLDGGIAPMDGLRYTFERSFLALTPTQRVRFAALELFDGADQPRELVERVLDAIPQHLDNSATARGDFLELVSRSLVLVIESDAPTARATDMPEERVTLHPLLHEFAREQWGSLDRETQNHGVNVLITVVSDFVSKHTHDWDVLAREEALIVGAIHRGVNAQINPQILISTITSFSDYLYYGGHWRLGVELFQMRYNAQLTLGDRAGQAETLNNIGMLETNLKHPEQARKFLDDSLKIRQELNDNAGLAETLGNLGHYTLEFSGSDEDAKRYFEQALQYAHDARDSRAEAIILNNLGDIEKNEGHLEPAAQFFIAALAIHETGDDYSSKGRTLGNLGDIRMAQSKLDDAARTYEQALAATVRAGDNIAQGRNLLRLARLAVRRRHRKEARRLYDEAIAIFEAKDVPSLAEEVRSEREKLRR